MLISKFTDLNRILIGFFVGLPGVANYQIRYTIVQGVRELSMLTFSGITPMASEYPRFKTDTRDLLNLYHNGVRVSLLVAAAGFGLICAIAEPIIVLWTGKTLSSGCDAACYPCIGKFFPCINRDRNVPGKGVG